jgi:hypothetical protein
VICVGAWVRMRVCVMMVSSHNSPAQHVGHTCPPPTRTHLLHLHTLILVGLLALLGCGALLRSRLWGARWREHEGRQRQQQSQGALCRLTLIPPKCCPFNATRAAATTRQCLVSVATLHC